MRKNYIHFLIITVLVISPLFSFGQATLSGGTLNIYLSPKDPGPFQNVKVTIGSTSYDLDHSQISWLVDGVIKKTEIGLKEFTVLSGKNGQKTTVKASVITPNNETKVVETSFVTSVLDLIFESVSYTPPFYKGRALNPNQGTVKVVAIPELIKNNGEKVPAQNVFYTWKKDGAVQQNVSGLGKNVFSFTGPLIVKDALIEVNVSSIDKSVSASKQITIKNIFPTILFYENSPIYGLMLNKAIKNTVNMQTDEFSVLAIPYFFSAGYTSASDLRYNWTMNGKALENQDPKNSFTTRIEKAGTGTANIKLKVSSGARIYQYVDNSYTINFQKM